MPGQGLSQRFGACLVRGPGFVWAICLITGWAICLITVWAICLITGWDMPYDSGFQGLATITTKAPGHD